MKYHILSVGVSKHRQVQPLQYCHRDAIDLYQLFISNVGNLGYTKLLTDNEASLTEIRTALADKQLTGCDKDDAFFLYFSGHGTVAVDETGMTLAHYLVPFDATEDFTSSCISVDYLHDALSKIPSKNKFVIIDSCFSGAVNKSKFLPGKIPKDLKTIKTVTQVIPGTGSFTLTASKDSEVSWEDPESEHGLFTNALLKELTKRRSEENFPVLSIVTPIMEEVVKESTARFESVQTPTMKAEFEGNVVLPVFKIPLPMSPALLDVPSSDSGPAATMTVPEIKLSDKVRGKMINDLTHLVSAASNGSLVSRTSYHRFVWQLMNNLRGKWDDIFQKYDGDINKVQTAIAKIEGESYQLIALGVITAAYGSDGLMAIYSEALVSVFEWSFARAGLVALIDVPLIIPLLAVNAVGMVCVATDNLIPLGTLLDSRIIDLNDASKDPYHLYENTAIFFGKPLGGYADKANDHIREVLNEYTWIEDIAPKIKGKMIDYQVQANFVTALILAAHGSRVWPDFGRYYANRIAPLIAKLKYDKNLIGQLSKLLSVKEDELRPKIAQMLQEMVNDGLGAGYFWDSIRPEQVLLSSERPSDQS